MSDIKVTRKKLSDYTPDPHNANLGSERGYRMIDDSITEDGVGRSGLVDKNGVVIAGNQTLEVLAANGIEDVIEIETTGKEWVIVKRTDTDLADADPNNMARRMAFRDNRSQQVSLTWNPEQLQADKEAGVEVVDKLWSPVELDILGVENGEQVEDPGAQIDRAAELQKKWQVQRGDIWQIGKHRIMCGDSTCAEDVEKLMGGMRADLVLTDPPYGIAHTGAVIPSANHKIHNGIANDDISIIPFATAFIEMLNRFFNDSTYFIFGVSGKIKEWQPILEKWRKVNQILIWVKDNSVLSRLHFHLQFEIIYHGYVTGSVWNGDHTQNDVLQYRSVNSFGYIKDSGDNNHANDAQQHPHQKPLSLFVDLVKLASNPNHVVYDPFIGSGTTIVAAENTGRVGYGMEIAPEYVAVCLERLAGMGLSPVRVESKSPIAGAVGGAE